MLWLLLSFVAAISESSKDLLNKRNLRNIDEYTVALGLRLSFLFLAPLLFFIEIPMVNNNFFIALVVSGIINATTTILYMKALKLSDISLSVPLLSFSPALLLITSPLILGEIPSLLGLVGVLLIVGGSYILNVKERHKGYLQPFKALIEQPGPKYMLLVALLWSISSNFDKIGVQNSSPLFWTICINFFMTICMLPIVLYKRTESFTIVSKNLKLFLPVAFIGSIGLLAQMTAISLTLVAYVIAIKRTSIVMSVLMGSLLFKEKGLRERLIGAAIMVFGVICISLS